MPLDEMIKESLVNKLFKRQFVICEHDVRLEHLKKFSIPSSKLTLYCCPSLCVSTFKEGLIIGDFFSTCSQENVVELLSGMNNEKLNESLKKLGGRYIVLVDGDLIPDATVNFQCFYTKSKAKKQVISSSLLILEKLFRFRVRSNYKTPSYLKDSLNWFPGPFTVLNGVRRLMVDQKLRLKTQSVSSAGYYDDLDAYSYSNDEIICEITKTLNSIVKNVKRDSDKRFTIAMTAGLDSRTILSAALKENVPFTTVTMEHDFISMGDIKLPNTLSSEFGYTHNYIPRIKELNKAKHYEFKAFCFNQVNDADALFYAHDQFSRISDQSILIRGGMWELGRDYYPELKECFINGDLPYSRFPILRSSRFHYWSLTYWRKSKLESGVAENISNLFYLEQRIGCWLSAVEHSISITGISSIHVANCPLIIKNLLILSTKNLPKNYIQLEIIKKNRAELLDYKINPSYPLHDFRTKLKLLISIGFKTFVQKALDKILRAALK